MGSDAPPGFGGTPAGGFSLSLNYATVAEAKKAFEALSEGATIAMPLGKAFWAEAFGMLTDRFGTPWMVGCEKRRKLRTAPPTAAASVPVSPTDTSDCCS